MHQEPAIAIEVHPAANDAYHAHAAARFQGCVCIPEKSAINPLSQVLAIKSYSCSMLILLENGKGQQSVSWL